MNWYKEKTLCLESGNFECSLTTFGSGEIFKREARHARNAVLRVFSVSKNEEVFPKVAA